MAAQIPASKSPTLFRYDVPVKYIGLPGCYLYTEGVRNFATDNGASWVIDHILSLQTNLVIQGVPELVKSIQHWSLKKVPDRQLLVKEVPDDKQLLMELQDGVGNLRYSEIFQSDLLNFYEGEVVSLIFLDGVLMFPDEL